MFVFTLKQLKPERLPPPSPTPLHTHDGRHGAGHRRGRPQPPGRRVKHWQHRARAFLGSHRTARRTRCLLPAQFVLAVPSRLLRCCCCRRRRSSGSRRRRSGSSRCSSGGSTSFRKYFLSNGPTLLVYLQQHIMMLLRHPAHVRMHTPLCWDGPLSACETQAVISKTQQQAWRQNPRFLEQDTRMSAT